MQFYPNFIVDCSNHDFVVLTLSEVESRHGASRPRRGFGIGVAKPRRDETLEYRDETRDFIFRCPEVDMGFAFFFGHFNSNFRFIAGSYVYVYYLNQGGPTSALL